MPKTMTFERREYELIRKLLSTELKRAQTAYEKAAFKHQNTQSSSPLGSLHAVENLQAHRDLVAKLLQEATNLPVMVSM